MANNYLNVKTVSYNSEYKVVTIVLDMGGRSSKVKITMEHTDLSQN